MINLPLIIMNRSIPNFNHRTRIQQVGADVVVAFYDKVSRVFRAEDYYLSHLSQCDGKQGVCPDERIGGRNDVEVSE